MAVYTNQLTQRVFDIVAPLIGDLMCKGVLKNQTASIGKTEETLIATDIPKLAEGIRKGLTIFIGSDASYKVADQIKKIA